MSVWNHPNRPTNTLMLIALSANSQAPAGG
jgi:hypothetical protein